MLSVEGSCTSPLWDSDYCRAPTMKGGRAVLPLEQSQVTKEAKVSGP